MLYESCLYNKRFFCFVLFFPEFTSTLNITIKSSRLSRCVDMSSSEGGQLRGPWTWHIPDKWLDPNESSVLYFLFMISGRCQGLVACTPITRFWWYQCQLLCCEMMLVSQMLRGRSVTRRFMRRDQREAGLTSITLKRKGQRPLEIRRRGEAKAEQRAACLENSMDRDDVRVGSTKQQIR